IALIAAATFAADGAEIKGARAFEPLRAGDVKPAAWLRDWELAARDGFTAVMDEIDPEFPRAWTADFAPNCPVGDWGHGSWSFEGGGYWFDGLVRMARQLDDPELNALVEKRLAAVLENHTPESIGHFYWLNPANEADLQSVHPDYGWGLWASGLFGRAMIEYYRATGDARALDAARCADDSSDFRCVTLTGLGSPPNNAFNAIEDFRHSGDPGVAETLTRFYDKRDVDWPGLWEPYRTPPAEALWKGEKHYPEDWVMRFHGVFFNESLAGWGAGTLWTGRPEFLEAAAGWAKLMDERCLQPYGALVEDECYGPSGAYRCTETCTLAAELWRRVQLFTLTGDGAEADKIERLAFNAAAGAVSRDFTKHVYFQQPNRVSTASFIYSWGNPTNCVFQRKHYPLCCTAGVNRLLPTFVQYLWMKTPDDGLAAVLYAPNALETDVRGQKVRVETATNYPFEETITTTVVPEKSASFPISFRVPAWCAEPKITVAGEEIDVAAEKGFVKIEREWAPGDVVELRFPMAPRLELGVDRNAKPVAMPDGGAWGKGAVLGMYPYSELSATPCACVSFGPLLFALPIDEIDENAAAPGAVWQFALDPKTALDGAEV
ncbi:MAG: glycoside hydrolase family 127 protein, partial [Thermoguttaceae bacterium]|nr:glycoside hydrolase family 127 protein [Thermoguttaceae bacterium]